MAFAALGLQHGFVGHLVQQVVAEGFFSGVFEGTALAPLHQGLALQSGQGRWRQRVQRRQRVVPEHTAHDAGLLQRMPLGHGQCVQPRLQHASERGRYTRRGQAFGVHRPDRAFDGDDTIVDQHLQQLFHVVRVARRLFDEQFGQRGRCLRKAVQQGCGQGPAFDRAQCFQQQPFVAGNAFGPGRPALQQRGPCQAEHQHGPWRVHQLLQCIQRGLVGPMQVVGDQQHRLAPLGRQRLQPLAEGAQGAVAQLPGIHRHQVRAP
jgi:hypothetical protein